MLDEVDLSIINALQLSPRISWARLGRILTLDPSTLSRRWNRMTAEGLAWSSCYNNVPASVARRSVAMVEVGCEPGRREQVIASLAGEQAVSSIHCTSGRRDLVLTLTLSDVLGVDRYVDEVIATVPGVRRLETHHLRRMFQDGSDWRVRILDQAQVKAVIETRPHATVEPNPSSFLLTVLSAIGDDVRRPISELQPLLGRSLAAVSRAVDTLLAAGWARWRVDFSHNLLSWEEMKLWLDVPQDEMEGVAGLLRGCPQVRLCASATGTANLVATLWVREHSELDEIERKITRDFPKAHVVDRCIAPRIAKRMGHVIGYDSRVERYVPFVVTSS